MGFNIAKLMQQAKAMQAKAEATQAENDKKEFIGEAGAKAVTIKISGGGEMLSVTLDDSITTGMTADDKEVLEDLIIAAYNDANNKRKANTTDSLQDLGAGMDLSALKNLMPK
jgi:DNA-binding YbaB/EbfC family protein